MNETRLPDLARRAGRGPWVAALLALLLGVLLPVGLAVGAEEDDDSGIVNGKCEFAPDALVGPVLRTKVYEPPLATNCVIYTNKIVVWDTEEQERYFGYTTPETVCTINGAPVDCNKIKKNDQVTTVFERKVSSEYRGNLLVVHATRS